MSVDAELSARVSAVSSGPSRDGCYSDYQSRPRARERMDLERPVDLPPPRTYVQEAPNTWYDQLMLPAGLFGLGVAAAGGGCREEPRPQGVGLSSRFRSDQNLEA